MFDSSFNALLATAAHHPWLQSLAIVVGTFILEDAATVLAAMRAQDGGIPLQFALGALYVGIVLGDLGLYGLGSLAARIPWIEQRLPRHRTRPAQEWLESHLVAAVFTSRFIPGMRLPTYTACGYLGVPLGPFVLSAIGATLIWTSLLFGVSLSFGTFMIDHLGQWRWAGAIGFALGIILIGRLAARLPAVRR